MTKYQRLINDLAENNIGKMKAFGFSMLPLIKSGSMLTFSTKEKYEKGDIVFCKVKGRFIDAHLVTKVDKNKGYMIANNKGYENGWTKIIYGYVIEIEK